MIYEINVVIDNEDLPDTLIFDIRTLIAKFLPNANMISVRDRNNEAFYLQEGDHGIPKASTQSS